MTCFGGQVVEGNPGGSQKRKSPIQKGGAELVSGKRPPLRERWNGQKTGWSLLSVRSLLFKGLTSGFRTVCYRIYPPHFHGMFTPTLTSPISSRSTHSKQKGPPACAFYHYTISRPLPVINPTRLRFVSD